MSYTELHKLYNRRVNIHLRHEKMLFKKQKKKEDKLERRHRNLYRQRQTKRDMKSNLLISQYFVDRNFIMNA